MHMWGVGARVKYDTSHDVMRLQICIHMQGERVSEWVHAKTAIIWSERTNVNLHVRGRSSCPSSNLMRNKYGFACKEEELLLLLPSSCKREDQLSLFPSTWGTNMDLHARRRSFSYSSHLHTYLISHFNTTVFWFWLLIIWSSSVIQTLCIWTSEGGVDLK